MLCNALDKVYLRQTGERAAILPLSSTCQWARRAGAARWWLSAVPGQNPRRCHPSRHTQAARSRGTVPAGTADQREHLRRGERLNAQHPETEHRHRSG
jgi:hypothetical protein